MDLYESGFVHDLLDFITTQTIGGSSHGVRLLASYLLRAGILPMTSFSISPSYYREFVLPYKRLVEAHLGQEQNPLVRQVSTCCLRSGRAGY